MHTFDIVPIEVNQKMAFFRYEMFRVGFKPRKKFGFETHNLLGGLKPNKSLLQSLGLSSTQQFATRYLSNRLHHAGIKLSNQTEKIKLKPEKNVGFKIWVSNPKLIPAKLSLERPAKLSKKLSA